METDIVKRSLLESALKLFTEDGYDAVSVSKIRTGAGVSNGSFFYVFPSKPALAAALLVACVTEYQAAVIADLSPVVGAADGVASMISKKLHWVCENQAKARFLLDDARSQWFALAATALRDQNQEFAATVDRWREPLIASGALRTMQTDVFMATLIGPANLLCRLWLAGLKPDLKSPLLYEDDLVQGAQRALVSR